MDLRSETAHPQAIYLRDYQPPAYRVEQVSLHFVLDEETTRVDAELEVLRADDTPATTPLSLDGDGLILEALFLNGELLGAENYTVTPDRLTLPNVPSRFRLSIRTRLRPQENTALSGLYKSSGNFCTQCEAEGFRRITYFLDRPDVMARYRVTLEADVENYPVLLSNGNLIETGVLDGGRHYAVWDDPYPKPSYLFALVAGKLDCIEDSFTTASGRTVSLFVYVQPHNIDMCGHAMASLKKAMQWDEAVYGREYDLDRYMIVAVDDFNMGAMENKGLNIFNSKYVLARPDTATDMDYQNIEGVIGHEYFHNWSGNRVTCRDWFQLSLKEGFTVFRDQEFTADMNSRAVKRIQDVNMLRTHQFREDAGPMSHPVRPDAYIEINNFYTATVYNKGAEVVRMLHTLLGPEGFRQGTDLYFDRHDGQAVTTDDFVRAMEDANGVSFVQFRRWYNQAGTPVVEVEATHNAQTQTYAMTFRQTCPPTPGQTDKQPFHIPMAMALLDAEGQAMPLQLYGESEPGPTERVLNLCKEEETFVFQHIPSAPVPSLLRGFSAPVRLQWDVDDAALCFLFAHDSDGFSRWDAGQRLATRLILQLAKTWQQGGDMQIPAVHLDAYAGVLQQTGADPAFQALLLQLPSELYLAEFMQVIDPQALHAARQYLRRAIAEHLCAVFEATYHRSSDDGPYVPDAASAGRRSLRNLCLGYLMELDEPQWVELCVRQFENAQNMTDSLAALTALAQRPDTRAEACLDSFYQRWRHEPLVVDKWLAVQATSRREDALERVQALTEHPAFNLKNPNKVYALLRNFAQANPVRFHRPDGAAYRFLGDRIQDLDALNPQVAARLAAAFNEWRRHDTQRRDAQCEVLNKLKNNAKISRDLNEIISKSLT